MSNAQQVLQFLLTKTQGKIYLKNEALYLTYFLGSEMVSLKYYLVDKNVLRTWVNNKVIVTVQQCMFLCVIKKINFNKIVY